MSFHLAGFVGTAPTPRPSFLAPSVPDPFVTISPCLAKAKTHEVHGGWFEDPRSAAEPDLDVLAIGMSPRDRRTWLTDFTESSPYVALLRRALPM